MKDLLFYAALEDLKRPLEDVEAGYPLKYVRFGQNRQDTPANVFRRATELPQLGIADSPSCVSCASYVVLAAGAEAKGREIARTSGEMFVAIDQLLNPESVVISPGGVWNGEIVIQGKISSAHENPVSVSLMKLYRAALRNSMASVGGIWVGPTAMSMFESGKRLTIAEQSPSRFDLHR